MLTETETIIDLIGIFVYIFVATLVAAFQKVRYNEVMPEFILFWPLIGVFGPFYGLYTVIVGLAKKNSQPHVIPKPSAHEIDFATNPPESRFLEIRRNMPQRTKVLTIIVPPTGPICSFYGLQDLQLEDVKLIIRALEAYKAEAEKRYE